MMLVYILVLSAYRVMKLKDSDNIITHKQDRLVQEKTTFDNIEDQYVVVHDRIIYFYKKRIYYTLGATKKDIEVKVIESEVGRNVGKLNGSVGCVIRNGHCAKIGYMERRVEIDAFNLGHNKKNQNEGAGNEKRESLLERLKKRRTNIRSLAVEHKPSTNTMNEIKGSLQGNNILNSLFKDTQKPLQANTENSTSNQSSNKNQNPTLSNIYPSQYTPSADNMPYDQATQIINTSIPIEPQTYLEKPPINIEHQHFSTYPYDNYMHEMNVPDDFNDKKKKSHAVESDSSMDDDYSLLFKDVTVREIDDKYFQLASESICVTFYGNKFIFAPCSIKNGNQLFTMLKSDDLLKNFESKKNSDEKHEDEQHEDEKRADEKRADEQKVALENLVKTITKIQENVSTVTVYKEIEKKETDKKEVDKKDYDYSPKPIDTIEKTIDKSSIANSKFEPMNISKKTLDFVKPDKNKFDKDYDNLFRSNTNDSIDDKNNFLTRLEQSFTLKGLDLGTVE